MLFIELPFQVHPHGTLFVELDSDRFSIDDEAIRSDSILSTGTDLMTLRIEKCHFDIFEIIIPRCGSDLQDGIFVVDIILSCHITPPIFPTPVGIVLIGKKHFDRFVRFSFDTLLHDVQKYSDTLFDESLFLFHLGIIVFFVQLIHQ